MPRLLSDQNFNERIIRGLQRRVPELDCVLLRERGYEQASDPSVLDLALSEDRVLLTQDAKTMVPFAERRLAAGELVPRLVLVPRWMAIGAAIDDIELVLLAGTNDDWHESIMRLPLRTRAGP